MRDAPILARHLRLPLCLQAAAKSTLPGLHRYEVALLPREAPLGEAQQRQLPAAISAPLPPGRTAVLCVLNLGLRRCERMRLSGRDRRRGSMVPQSPRRCHLSAPSPPPEHWTVMRERRGNERDCGLCPVAPMHAPPTDISMGPYPYRSAQELLCPQRRVASASFRLQVEDLRYRRLQGIHHVSKSWAPAG